MNNVARVVSGEGAVEFDGVIEASFLRVYPYCNDDDNYCIMHSVQCFRIDLFQCPGKF